MLEIMPPLSDEGFSSTKYVSGFQQWIEWESMTEERKVVTLEFVETLRFQEMGTKTLPCGTPALFPTHGNMATEKERLRHRCTYKSRLT